MTRATDAALPKERPFAARRRVEPTGSRSNDDPEPAGSAPNAPCPDRADETPARARLRQREEQSNPAKHKNDGCHRGADLSLLDHHIQPDCSSTYSGCSGAKPKLAPVTGMQPWASSLEADPRARIFRPLDRRFVNDPAADDGHRGTNPPDCFVRNGDRIEQVTVQHDDVAKLARFN